MRTHRPPFLYTRIAILVATLFASAFVLANPAVGTTTAHASHPANPARSALPVPAAPRALPAAIEPQYVPYVPQDTCDPVVRPGTRKLAELLARTYRSYGGTDWASTYACGTDGSVSEHYEGRAIDWMVGVGNPRQHAAALAVIHWLLATDAQGNQDAMARRLGVMYLIYDNRIWEPWSGWQPYLNCAKLTSAAYANMCHRTHVHISLTWNGAMGRTSFWTDKVYPTDYGPCRQPGLNWAYRYTRPNLTGCEQVPEVVAPKHSSALKRTLVTYSGAWLHGGSSGPAVDAVQQAMKVGVTGSWNAATRAAVRRFQAAHHLPRSGAMKPATWLALLPTVH